jgi:hypothetical protein
MNNPYITIDITTQEPQLPSQSVANVMIFTNEKPFNDVYRRYNNSTLVAQDFGSSSVTTKLAQDIFAQSPTIRTGGGELYIMPFLGSVDATSGTFTSGTLDVENFQSVLDGKIQINVDSVSIRASGLDFSNIVTAGDIIDILNNIKDKPFQNLDFAIVDGKLVATSKSYGTTSTVAIVVNSTDTGTDLAGAQYFDIDSGVATTGTNSSGETLQEVLERAESITGTSKPFFVLFTTTRKIEKTALITAISYVQSLKIKMFWYFIRNTAELNLTEETSLNSVIVAQQYFNTRISCDAHTSIASNLHVCALSLMASINWESNGTYTSLFHKTLASCTPSNILKSVPLLDLGAISRYIGGGDFLDAKIRGYSSVDAFSLIWLIVTIESSIHSLLKTSSNIPQTENGVAIIKNTLSDVFTRAVSVGMIAPGTWNGEAPFDDEVLKDSIARNGYYVRSQPIAEQSQADREAGKAPPIQCAFKYAGSIIVVNIIGTGQF